MGIRGLISKENREKGYILAAALFVFARIFSYSLYSESSLSVLFKPVYFLCYFLVAVKVIPEIFLKEFRWKEWLLIGGIGVFLFFNMRATGIRHAFLYWIFIVGSRGVEYKKIVKWAAIAHFAALLIVFASCGVHLLENLIYTRGDVTRQSLGFSYTSEPANFFFYAAVLWVYSRDRRITYAEIAVLLLADVVIYTLTGTTSAFVLTLAVLGIDLALRVFPVLGKWRKGYKGIAWLIAPLAAVFILLVTALYDPSVPWMGKLNNLVHDRLYYGKAGLEQYGVPLFGQSVTWIGNTATHLGKYNYVDSSFIQTLINYGWVFFVLLMMALIRFGKAVADHKDTHLLLVFCAVILHGTFDPQLIWIMFNSLWLAYAYCAEKDGEQEQAGVWKPKEGRKWLQPALGCVLAGLIAAAVLIPGCSGVLNRALYLNPKNKGYDHWLLNAKSRVVETEEDICLLTTVSKTGFGEVAPEDLAFYVQAAGRMHPEISRTTLCFTDGTGVAISLDHPENGQYGAVDENGLVIGDAVPVTLKEPLKDQVDGISTYIREYDADGNIVYQFHVDAEGNGIADANGAAGYRRTYDNRHRVLTDGVIGMDGELMMTASGYAEIRRVYQDGRVAEQWYYDEKGEPVRREAGYAAFRRTYDQDGRILTVTYLDEEGQPAKVGDCGYTSFRREYDSEGNLSLIWYYDADGHEIECGSGYFHQYLQSLKGRDLVIFISARDEASYNITEILSDDLKALGLQEDLRGKYRYSYCAVITPEGVHEELSEEPAKINGEYDGIRYEVSSKGFLCGDDSSIRINGQEYSQNTRGLNIVLMENGQVVDSVAFDTYSHEMKVTR